MSSFLANQYTAIQLCRAHIMEGCKNPVRYVYYWNNTSHQTVIYRDTN